MSRHYDVTVLTVPSTREAITKATSASAGNGPAWLYYDIPPFLRRLTRNSQFMRFHYVLWQLGARWHLRAELPKFDIIHHVTYNTFIFPGFWWWTKRCLILGPLGGGQTFPSRFLRVLGWQALPELMRSLHVRLQGLNPAFYINCAMAQAILVANSDTARKVPKRFRHKTHPMPEIGVAAEQLRVPPHTTEPHLVWIGRLVRTKGLELGLRALAVAIHEVPTLRLTVLGNGPEMPRLKALAQAVGVSAHVDWRGGVPHADVGAILQSHRALLFTSLRDTTGSVVLEAMAAGLPLITVCHQGVREVTTEATALRVPPTSLTETINGLAAAMIRLANEDSLQKKLGQAGQQRVRDLYLWEDRGKFMSQMYEQALRSIH